MDPQTTYEVARSGISLGTVIAVVASWSRNKSILWAIFHGLFGWVYVIYYVLTEPLNGKTITAAVASVILAVCLIAAFFTLFG